MVKNVLNINYSDNNKTNDVDINGNIKSKPSGNSNCCRKKKCQLNGSHKKINIIYRAKVESGNSVKYNISSTLNITQMGFYAYDNAIKH